MNRTVLILIGVILLFVGGGYCLFWGQAYREAQSLFSNAQAQDPEVYQEQFPYFLKATRILGMDILAPGAEESAADANELAQKITRGIYANLALGAAVLLMGLVVVIVGIARRREEPEA
jgi:hypothetical protein